VIEFALSINELDHTGHRTGAKLELRILEITIMEMEISVSS
jgi:hypothetical protein